uniref:Cilia-and flagella-associated protein 20 (Trinotate prediction) n=1 Tax=Henneguya salminicola TaxID=69463 RepID=A0A6G3MKI5_HENSL
MPIFVMIIKNVNRYFSFELKVKDDSDTVRHLRASNYEYKTRIHQHICTFPLILESGWNVVTLNIIEILKKIYSSNYVETISVQVFILNYFRFMEIVVYEEYISAIEFIQRTN